VHDRNDQYAIRLIDVKNRIRENGGKVPANGRNEQCVTFRVPADVIYEAVNLGVKPHT
jgi:hypothetical protein